MCCIITLLWSIWENVLKEVRTFWMDVFISVFKYSKSLWNNWKHRPAMQISVQETVFVMTNCNGNQLPVRHHRKTTNTGRKIKKKNRSRNRKWEWGHCLWIGWAVAVTLYSVWPFRLTVIWNSIKTYCELCFVYIVLCFIMFYIVTYYYAKYHKVQIE